MSKPVTASPALSISMAGSAAAEDSSPSSAPPANAVATVAQPRTATSKLVAMRRRHVAHL